MWRERLSSLKVRRVAAGAALIVAAALVYVSAVIPQAVSLPFDEVNKRAVARPNEELRIYKPQLNEGDAVLSYTGGPNETAEVWIDHAALMGPSKAMLGPLASPDASAVIYTAGDGAKKDGKDCRTSIAINRAEGTGPLTTIELTQKDHVGGQQQFRQVLFRSPGTPVQVQISTDSPVAGPAALTQCPRLVKIGDASVELPAGPLYLLVPAGWVNMRFSSADPLQPAFKDDDATLNTVSLGGDALEAGGLDVLSTKLSKTPLLHVAPHQGTDAITLHGLKVAAHELKLDVGEDSEKADAYVNGKPITPLDIVGWIQKNPVLSFLFATVLIPSLWKVCFPGSQTAK